MYDNEVKHILGKFAIFEKMYDEIRFVDPTNKMVIDYKSPSASHKYGSNCYDFWEANQVCDNCIAIRAYTTNQTFVKVEYASGEVYMATAVPVELGTRRAVVELLKNVTNSLILGDLNTDNKSEMYAMIDNMNSIALRDSLTGVYNRRYLTEKLPIDIVNAALLGKSISVIMADIDHFKGVNDAYGHLIGDSVLKSFAETLLKSVRRESDWVSRYGGEEFLICLPGASITRSVEIAEHMRRTTEEKVITCGEHSIKITASFGVCSIKPASGINVESLIDCADKQMYLAKHNGRNRVEPVFHNDFTD
ncbi:MAG: signal transduction GGDEF domain-containing protein [Bacillota bacterium]|nr:MAG: signal transduction GGDEF domain-containing protein [Bacillota bacterium]